MRRAPSSTFPGPAARRRRVGRGLAVSLAAALGVAAAAAAGMGAAGAPSGPHERFVRLVEPSGPAPVRAARARTTLGWRGGLVTTSTGERVNVLVSNRYTPEQHTPEAWAEFLSSSPHGPELAALTAHIAPLDELAEICGPQALGCYGSQQLFAAGDTVAGVTPQEIVRHELGHHIAANRLNPPWRAIDWGPKAWATDQGICTRAANGTAYPGDEGDHYSLNPGEAWAESYRVFAEQRAGSPTSPWQIVDSSFQPDAEALATVERDVLRPWQAPTVVARARRFTASTSIWSIPITTAADGDIAITVSLPKGGYHRVVLLGEDRKTLVARGLWSGTRTQRITATICGRRSLVLRITRRGSIGRVVVAVTKP